jgi:hypothetical protein
MRNRSSGINRSAAHRSQLRQTAERAAADIEGHSQPANTASRDD